LSHGTQTHWKPNAAVLFFVEDSESVLYFNSQFDIDLHSLVAHVPAFQLDTGVEEVFDSNTSDIVLPERVLRLVGFRFSDLRFGSKDYIILFQIQKSKNENMFLVSIDTSFQSLSKRQERIQRLHCIECLGAAILRALTRFNSSMSVFRIPTLHVPIFPPRLKIRSRISDEALSQALISGMAREQDTYSPNVQLQSQR
jgi:hypothetical protein